MPMPRLGWLRLTIAAALFFIVGMPSAGAQQEAWSRQFGGAGEGLTQIVDSATGATGNIYVVGYTDEELPGQTSSGPYGDGFVRKYDTAGAELWTRQFGVESGYGLNVGGAAARLSGGVYVFGSTSSNGVLPGQVSAGASDAYVRAYDASGTELWTHQFGTSRTDFNVRGAVGPTGIVYVVGQTFGEFPGYTSNERDVFVRAYDPAGAELWTRQFGSADDDDDTPYGVAADAGGLYVTGTTFGTFAGQTQTGQHVIDGFVLRIDPAGTLAWVRQFGNAFAMEPRALAIDPVAGDVFIAGRRDVPNTLDTEAWIDKFHPDGSLIWERAYESSTVGLLLPSDLPEDAATDSSGNLYLAGSGDNGAILGGDLGEIVVRRFAPDGSDVWRIAVGTAGDDRGNAISTDADGNVFAGGIADYRSEPYCCQFGDALLVKIVQSPSCFKSGNSTAEEAGVLSTPIHQIVEPTVDDLGLARAVHRINCRVIVPLGL